MLAGAGEDWEVLVVGYVSRFARDLRTHTFTLTAHAKARGWDAAFGAGVVRVKEGQSGRGERI